MEGIEKTLSVKSCSLEKEALLSLFDILSEKASNAATHNVNALERMGDENDADFFVRRNEAGILMRISVLIKLNNGHWHRAFSKEVFDTYLSTYRY